MNHIKIGIIGLGYVGLPLAAAFAKKYTVIGVDINQQRITELTNFQDSTHELTSQQLEDVVGKTLTITKDINQAKD